MNIYSEPGTKVIFYTLNAGYNSEQKHIQNFLELGKTYTVKEIRIDSFVSYVEFEEFPELWFNTVFFENLEYSTSPINTINTWSQGYFVDGPQYNNWKDSAKYQADKQEKLLVRPGPTENAICKCNNPHDAKWIAKRLNMLANIELQYAQLFTEDITIPEFLSSVKNIFDP